MLNNILLQLVSLLFLVLFPCKSFSQIEFEYKNQQNKIKDIKLKELSSCFYQYALSPYTESYNSSDDWREGVWGLNSRFYINDLDSGLYKVSGGYGVDACSSNKKPICYMDKESYVDTSYGIRIGKCILQENKIVMYYRNDMNGMIEKDTVAYKNFKWNKGKEIERWKWHIEYLKNNPNWNPSL